LMVAAFIKNRAMVIYVLLIWIGRHGYLENPKDKFRINFKGDQAFEPQSHAGTKQH
jgi:hypothetical protein